eukprot:360895-Chlamydomonas_euryale.AAC.1
MGVIVKVTAAAAPRRDQLRVCTPRRDQLRVGASQRMLKAQRRLQQRPCRACRNTRACLSSVARRNTRACLSGVACSCERLHGIASGEREEEVAPRCGAPVRMCKGVL